jgi:hypothetical protein
LHANHIREIYSTYVISNLGAIDMAICDHQGEVLGVQKRNQ